MSFQINPLSSTLFQHLYHKSDDELLAVGAHSYIADEYPGFPCRIELRDAEPGERLILINFQHQSANSPYKSSHAIFIIDGAVEHRPPPNQVPKVLARRQLSVRAFNKNGMMLDGVIIDGASAANCFDALLENPEVDYLHAHNAGRGCFAAEVIRN